MRRHKPRQNQPAKDWKTIKQMAERYQLSVRMIAYLAADRTLPSYKIGHALRFDPVECDQAMRAFRRNHALILLMRQAELNSNFMKIKRARTTINRRSSTPVLVAMRTWKGKRSITRTVLLLTCLEGILKPGSFVEWLETPKSRLNGRAPIDLLALGKWTVVADVIDDMLTGAPS